ncbi:DUF2789 domain-containing protein [Parahaliea mediterranea]|uniref:DUF2789 domain-containing protein n=2 Tax=Parahaliea mediterranea TaxID=651086 RepID=A0A939DI15_9GAMM|nr:DUF2789 domain-containing protein [Parahaliea mediterranea]
MEPAFHSMKALFEQLGLPSSDSEITAFIDRHVLAPGTALHRANFWSEAQARFLRDCIEADADWAEVVDHLDARLRR